MNLPITIHVGEQPAVLDPHVRRVRTFDDPLMPIGNLNLNTANFQAVKGWSPEGGWTGQTGFVWVPLLDMWRIHDMQLEDQYPLKDPATWRLQKMDFLTSDKGGPFIDCKDWQGTPAAKFPMITIGGNPVWVEAIEEHRLEIPNVDPVKRLRRMARLRGITRTEFRSLFDEAGRVIPARLLAFHALGLVHRMYIAYMPDEHTGDTKYGIVYNIFPVIGLERDGWDYAGTIKPRALYLPEEWLAPHG